MYNISLIVGDFTQFPPIHDSPLYYGTDQSTRQQPATRQSEVERELGRACWQGQLTHAIILDEQHRVIDPVYLGILERLAEGKCTEDDYQLLLSRVIGSDNVNITDPKFITAPIIVPGNELRVALNRIHAVHAAQTSKQPLLITRSLDTCTKVNLTPSKKQQLWSIPNTKANGLPGELELLVGMPVMLTTNLAVELKLTNGCMGTITHIQLDQRETVPEGGSHILQYRPHCIIVKFDNCKCPTLDGLDPGEVPIFPVKGSFQFQFPMAKTRCTISREQFPLVPAYAYTAHKVLS